MNPSPFPSITVDVSDTQDHLRVDPQALIDLTGRVLRGEGIDRAAISLALVDNATIRDLNRRHLNHDWPTDVIAFPLSGPEDPEPTGDLVLSAEMARQTAERAGTDPWAELALYLVHGLLHLCGYDDQTSDQAAAMRRREAEVLASAGLINTFPLVGPPADPSERRGLECST
jgi:probable rRNA maturation factor